MRGLGPHPFPRQLRRQGGEVIDEMKRVLAFVADAGLIGLRGKLFRFWINPNPGSAQFCQRARERRAYVRDFLFERRLPLQALGRSSLCLNRGRGLAYHVG